MYSTSVPVTAGAFFDRQKELGELQDPRVGQLERRLGLAEQP